MMNFYGLLATAHTRPVNGLANPKNKIIFLVFVAQKHQLVINKYSFFVSRSSFFFLHKAFLIINIAQSIEMEASSENNGVSPALMRLRNKPEIPRIDFTVYTQEDGTVVSTRDRVIKGEHCSKDVKRVIL